MIKHRQIDRAPFPVAHGVGLVALAAAGLLASGFVAPAQAGSSGWQTPSTYTGVVAGQTELFYHYPCPASPDIVWNGAYAMNSVGQSSEVYLGFNGPRLDENPASYAEWGWHFYWPAGAPAGVTITFNVFCGWKHTL